MAVNDWKIGQPVVVYLPHYNTDNVKNTSIVGIGRKFITVDGLQHRFDATKNPPMSSGNGGTDGWLYTPERYAEVAYARRVIRVLSSRMGELPFQLLLTIGDYFAVERPDHLRDDIDPALLKSIKDSKL